MAAHFPTPHPDELFYSLCARFSARVGYPGARAIPHELFGSYHALAVVDLPNRLDYLSATLPAGSSLDADYLIERCTLFPFYSAFLPPSRVKKLRQAMRGSSGPASHRHSGIRGSHIPTPDSLMFCTVCKQEDESNFRETYWHRLHQVPGVLVCPVHNTFLDESSAKRTAGRKSLIFISADTATHSLTVRYLDPANQEHQVLRQIACDAAWLLEHPISGTEGAALRSRYQRLLISKGFAKYTGRIHAGKLLNEVRKYFSPTLRERLHCEFAGKDQEKANWFLRLVRRRIFTQNPLYHLLLIQFLGCTVEEFFQLPDELYLFGQGPWPCLNPIADHFRQPVITSFTISRHLHHGHPVGIFSCECGFIYTRRGPDSSPEDRFLIGSIASFGHVWEAELRKLWADQTLPLKDIVGRLKSTKTTVRRHAARLKLYSSGSGRKLKPPDHKTELKGDASMAARGQKRCDCRVRWLSAKRRNPKITLKELRRVLPREYVWLRRNDSIWFRRHCPKPQKRTASTSRVNWSKRDMDMAAAVKASAQRLKNAPGRPIRVTTTSIGRDVGAISLLQQYLHKMPLTAQILKSVAESDTDFSARRIQWATDQYIKEGVMPRSWQLVARASVYYLISAKGVREAVDAAIIIIQARLHQEFHVIHTKHAMGA